MPVESRKDTIASTNRCVLCRHVQWVVFGKRVTGMHEAESMSEAVVREAYFGTNTLSLGTACKARHVCDLSEPKFTPNVLD